MIVDEAFGGESIRDQNIDPFPGKRAQDSLRFARAPGDPDTSLDLAQLFKLDADHPVVEWRRDRRSGSIKES